MEFRDRVDDSGADRRTCRRRRVSTGFRRSRFALPAAVLRPRAVPASSCDGPLQICLQLLAHLPERRHWFGLCSQEIIQQTT